jgi:hypothetical protein
VTVKKKNEEIMCKMVVSSKMVIFGHSRNDFWGARLEKGKNGLFAPKIGKMVYGHVLW